MKLIIATFFILILASASSAKADKYDDCILDNMKNVTSDTAAKAIMQACFNKYPKKTETKTYQKNVCKKHTTQRVRDLDMSDAFWDGDYAVVTLRNKLMYTVIATFVYTDGNAENMDKGIRLPKYTQYIAPKNTAVFRIHKDDIHYLAQGRTFNYGFEATYEICNKVKVEN